MRFILCIFAALLITGIWAATLWQLHQNEQAELDSARREAISLARLFKEHAYRTIEDTDRTIIYLQHRYSIEGKNLNIAQNLKEVLAAADIYNLFTIVDRTGEVILSTKPFSPMNLSDREHVRVHVQSPDVGLFISKPTLGRVSGRWSLQMTRRINAADGSYNGVIVASMDPTYFSELYKGIDVGNFGAIALIGEDGVIRVRHVGKDDAMGQDISDGKFFKTMQAHGNGVTRDVSGIDHRERMLVYDKLDAYHLYVVVGIDINERLAAFRANRTETLVLTALSSLLILLGTAALVIVMSNLIESRREAELAGQAKLFFLSNMSHEFRTPLNGILGYSEALMEDLAGSHHAQFAQTIHNSGLRLLALVEAVLEVSALRSGKISLSYSEERLQDILVHAMSHHEELAHQKGLSITNSIAADVPEHIYCDQAKLLRVLDKLLDNAVRFTDTGQITLGVTIERNNFLFSIADTGCGIAPELQNNIFEKFAQIDESVTREHGGLGLGLTIAASLVHLMGGKIWLSSALQVGSTFYFRLPLITTPHEDATRTIDA